MTITTEHKGLPVRKHSAAIRGASGDALNGALKVAPQDFKQGTPAYMVLEVMPNGENYKPMDDGDAYEEVEIVRVVRGAFIDGKAALPYLDDVTVKLEDLRVQETGQDSIGDEHAHIAMEADHANGLHKRKRPGCPLCHPITDEQVAKADELATKRAEKLAQHGDGEGDEQNPTPPATKRRSRATGAAKRTRTKK